MQISRKNSILYRFFCLADETFQLLEKTKVKMKILKTLKLGERPYEGLSYHLSSHFHPF